MLKSIYLVSITLSLVASPVLAYPYHDNRSGIIIIDNPQKTQTIIINPNATSGTQVIHSNPNKQHETVIIRTTPQSNYYYPPTRVIINQPPTTTYQQNNYYYNVTPRRYPQCTTNVVGSPIPAVVPICY